MNYFSVHIYRKRAAGEQFAAQYIVETSAELTKKDLGTDLESRPYPPSNRGQDEPFPNECRLAYKVSQMLFFDTFGRPAGDYWRDFRFRFLSEMVGPPAGNSLNVMGIRAWLIEEGDPAAHI
jgi:hypothetical protein